MKGPKVPRRSRLLAAAAAILVVTGAGITAVALVQMTAEGAQQQRLLREWNAALPRASPTPAAPTSPTPNTIVTPTTVPPVPAGNWFVLRVPDVHYTEVVREGVSSSVLAGGPGHYPGTAWPGWPGNVGVGVHNSYWERVGQLQPGRQVVLETEYGTFTYEIVTGKIVNPDVLGLFTQDDPQRVTLTTCWPLWAGAAATQRLVMVGNQVSAVWRIAWPSPQSN